MLSNILPSNYTTHLGTAVIHATPPLLLALIAHRIFPTLSTGLAGISLGIFTISVIHPFLNNAQAKLSLSHYCIKWKKHHPFSEFLAGRPPGRPTRY